MNKVISITIISLISIFSYKKFFSGEADLVTSRLIEISKIAHTKKSMAPMPAALYAKNISKMFTEDVLLEYEDEDYSYAIKGRNDLVSKIALLKMKTHKFNSIISITNLKVIDNIATADITVEVVGALIGRNDLFKEVRDIQVTLVNIDNDWLLKHAEVID